MIRSQSFLVIVCSILAKIFFFNYILLCINIGLLYYFKGRNFRDFREFGVFLRKFDLAKCSSSGCLLKYIFSKISSREFFFFFYGKLLYAVMYLKIF